MVFYFMSWTILNRQVRSAQAMDHSNSLNDNDSLPGIACLITLAGMDQARNRYPWPLNREPSDDSAPSKDLERRAAKD
jgi:hypothetical protein